MEIRFVATSGPIMNRLQASKILEWEGGPIYMGLEVTLPDIGKRTVVMKHGPGDIAYVPVSPEKLSELVTSKGWTPYDD